MVALCLCGLVVGPWNLNRSRNLTRPPAALRSKMDALPVRSAGFYTGVQGLTNFLTERYSRQGLWSLFLMCAFPLHVWALLLAFRDISWLTERTNAWDAIGVLSYGVMFALIESVFVFAVIVLLGLLVPASWSKDKRTGLLAVLVLILAAWGMVSPAK